MKKIYLSVIGFSLICRVGVYGQMRRQDSVSRSQKIVTSPITKKDTGYTARKLHLDEINFVSSYYTQDGNHSAITGGIGTEQVLDLSNVLDLKLVWEGNTQNKNTLSLGMGYDYHSSASSAYVINSGLGKKDGTRIYPSFDLTHENIHTGTTIGVGAYYSGEYNYKSIGADIHFSQKTADKNAEFSAKAQAYLDRVTLIYPVELITQINNQNASPGAMYITTASGNRVLSSTVGSNSSKPELPTSPRNTYSASLSYSQIVNARLQLMVLGDVVAQNGYLSLPFHRVFFANGKDTIEHLPSSRFKLPIGLRLNYFAGDNIIFRTYYRYYTDNWGSNANTAGIEIAYKVTPFLSLSPFYRFYNQAASKYFAPYKQHALTDEYYTSNYEYAKFTSNFFGIGFRAAPPTGVLGMQSLHDVEVRYGHYAQNTDLVSDVISVALGFK